MATKWWKRKSANIESEDVKPHLICPLTNKERKIIKSTWPFIEDHWDEVYYTAFDRWFKTYPELTNVFPLAEYGNDPDVMKSPYMLKHRERFKKVFDLVIENVFDISKVSEKLLSLGKCHYTYGVQQKFSQSLGVAFTYSISIIKHWDLETTNAWGSLIRFIMNLFRRGIRLGAEAEGLKCSGSAMWCKVSDKKNHLGDEHVSGIKALSDYCPPNSVPDYCPPNAVPD